MLKPPLKSNESPNPSLETAPNVACSVEGGCPPSHRAARRITSVIIALLLLSLLFCGAYMVWSQSL